MAKGFRRVDRDQQFLLPPDMGDWLPPDHQVWFFLAAVAELDISKFCARHRLGGAGREAYDPRMLLTVLIYGYALGQRSSRQIERLCHTDVAFRIICAQDVPDHVTVARFRAAHEEAFTDVFAQVLALCARSGMGRVSTVAVDGTKIAADASRDATHGRDYYRVRAEQAMSEAATADAAEDTLFGQARGDEVPAEWADPASRGGRIRRCLAELDAQEAAREAEVAAAEAKAAQHLDRIAQQPVTGGDPGGVDPVAAAQARLDRELARRQGEIEAYQAEVAAARTAGRRLPIGRRVRDPRGGKRVKKAQAALDRANTRAAERPTRTAPQRRPDPAPRRNLTDPDSRILPTRNGWVQGYNAQLAVTADHLILAVGLGNDPSDSTWLQPMATAAVAAAEVLRAARPHRHPDDPDRIGLLLADAGYATEANLTAPGPDRLIACGKAHDLHRQAATDPTHGPPPAGLGPLDRMRHRLRTPNGHDAYTQRGATVEPVNGHLKDGIGLRRFARRGLTACRAELNLAAAVHNLRRLYRSQPA